MKKRSDEALGLWIDATHDVMGSRIDVRRAQELLTDAVDAHQRLLELKDRAWQVYQDALHDEREG